MDYEIRFWREVLNNTLHIILGVVVAHAFLPYLGLVPIVAVLLALGIAREIWQEKRGKHQPLYIHVIDSVTIALGGAIWYAVVQIYHINVDLL